MVSRVAVQVGCERVIIRDDTIVQNYPANESRTKKREMRLVGCRARSNRFRILATETRFSPHASKNMSGR
jgi:hypothetical protein